MIFQVSDVSCIILCEFFRKIYDFAPCNSKRHCYIFLHAVSIRSHIYEQITLNSHLISNQNRLGANKVKFRAIKQKGMVNTTPECNKREFAENQKQCLS